MDKAPPEKNGSEEKLLTIEATLLFTRYSMIFENCLTIESQDTNRYTTLNYTISVGTLRVKMRHMIVRSRQTNREYRRGV